jgi:hypothetical protein
MRRVSGVQGAIMIAPIDNWSVVVAHGRSLIGVLHGRLLAPAYELHTQIRAGAAPDQVSIAFKAMPLLLLFSLKELHVPEDAIVIAIRTLDQTEKTVLQSALEECELMVRKTLETRSPLVLQGPNISPQAVLRDTKGRKLP